MDDCPHASSEVSLASDKSFLNPRTWSCQQCGTTNTVWACLHCNHIGCGRCDEGHAHLHFTHTRHPLVLEINSKTVHCFECGFDLLGDSLSREIQLVKSVLREILSTTAAEASNKGRLSRQASIHLLDLEPSEEQEKEDREQDQNTTAEQHWKYTTLGKCLRAWIQYVAMVKKAAQEENEIRKRKALDQSPPPGEPPPPPPPPSKRKKLTPGITGLRNLGNTCYMNAVLQALSHIAFFREYLKNLGAAHMQSQQENPLSVADKRRQMFSRQTTVECFQHISHRPPARSGSGKQGSSNQEETVDGNIEDHVSLCNGLYELLRVMWSGKWATVTPHTFLNTVWKAVPSFYGFSQQDAQEFLCEFLDHLQMELESVPCGVSIGDRKDPILPKDLVSFLFKGTLLSKITCDHCDQVSLREEPFFDLSLDFPMKYHTGVVNKRASFRGKSLSLEICKLHELFALFNQPEVLPTYSCEGCQHNRISRPSAKKTMYMKNVPNVLRLHLKRFRWQGSSYTKIKQHVSFPFEFNIKPFVDFQTAAINHDNHYLYDLSSVVVHHGSGFSSGHYTSYCWNPMAESWVLCNDSRMSLASPHEVELAQAYILLYVRRHGCSGLPLGYKLPHTPMTAVMPSPLQRYSLSFSKKQQTQKSSFNTIRENEVL